MNPPPFPAIEINSALFCRTTSGVPWSIIVLAKRHARQFGGIADYERHYRHTIRLLMANRSHAALYRIHRLLIGGGQRLLHNSIVGTQGGV